MNNNPRYPITIEGQTLTLQFDTSDSPTKKGINMQFVMQNPPDDPRVTQELANKISVALQKRFGNAGIAIDYNERNPYKNVISFIVPITTISDYLMGVLKGQK
jgi:hypothetical protein